MAFRWACDACGGLHGSNPSRCRSCGSSVFTPISQEELARHSPSPTEVESLDPDQILTYGTTPDPDFASSPDVAPDGSIQTGQQPNPQAAKIHAGWRVPWWVVLGLSLFLLYGMVAYLVL